MTPVLLLFSGIIAFAATFFLVPAVRSYALRTGKVDIPDGDRKLHREAIPNIGGLAIFGGFVVGLSALWIACSLIGATLSLPHWAFFAGALAILATGFYDDVRGMGFKTKFFVQLIIAYSLLFAGYRIDVSFIPFIGDDPFSQALYSVPVTVLWIVGVMNAVNLIDGLDGLASGIAVIAFGFFALIFSVGGSPIGIIAVTILLTGVYAGFLVHNFSPASIFLGDSGSLLAGYFLAMVSLAGTNVMAPSLAFLVPIIVLGVPLVDTSVCMLRRMLEGRSPFSPDHDHIHHRLSAITSTRNATLILYAATTWFGLAAILILRFPPEVGYLIGAVTIASAVLGVRSLGYVSIQEAMSLRRYIPPSISERFLKPPARNIRTEVSNISAQSVGDGAELPPRSSRLHTIHVNPGSSSPVAESATEDANSSAS